MFFGFFFKSTICNVPLTGRERWWEGRRAEMLCTFLFWGVGLILWNYWKFSVVLSLLELQQKVTVALMSSKKNELVLSWKVHKKFMDLLNKFYHKLQQWILTWTEPNRVLNLSTLICCNGKWNFKDSVERGKVLHEGPWRCALQGDPEQQQGWACQKSMLKPG